MAHHQGNLWLLQDEGTNSETGIVSTCPLCLGSQTGAVSMATKGGLDLLISFSLDTYEPWIKGGGEEGSHWSPSVLDPIMVITESLEDSQMGVENSLEPRVRIFE